MDDAESSPSGGEVRAASASVTVGSLKGVRPAEHGDGQDDAAVRMPMRTAR